MGKKKIVALSVLATTNIVVEVELNECKVPLFMAQGDVKVADFVSVRLPILVLESVEGVRGINISAFFME